MFLFYNSILTLSNFISIKKSIVATLQIIFLIKNDSNKIWRNKINGNKIDKNTYYIFLTLEEVRFF